ncbi:thioredoxin [Streptomyces sp. NE5-10]|uniref:thioredoxin family protein n=1 Tax=Streptomyces sp. NE5-10 TaxID=2759674 RepID=UPI0019034BDE|nr:thioredoxin domain-containing protein [Streptomyces sp. NE5-10]GHJ93288.1 thioredoxin [Streptomyces sp. NE5-10]
MGQRVHQPREDAEFDFVLDRTEGPVLAYFIGTWTKAIEPCRAMDLAVGAVADAYAGRLTVVRADLTRCPAAARRHGITGAPSCVLLKDGEAVAHGAGPLTHTEVRELIDAHL